MLSGYPDPAANAAPASANVADSQPALATAAPAAYLDVAALDFVPWRELADRHAWLLEQIKAAGTGQDVRLPGIRAAALALVAVLAELDLRARGHKAAADHHYWCACGFACIGMDARPWPIVRVGSFCVVAERDDDERRDENQEAVVAAADALLGKLSAHQIGLFSAQDQARSRTGRLCRAGPGAFTYP